MKTYIVHWKKSVAAWIQYTCFFLKKINWKGPLNDEKKLQIDEKNNKNWKVWKILKPG